ncbi:MAG: hypothetical protein ACLTDS_09295 [Bianqueaceae bacterium]
MKMHAGLAHNGCGQRAHAAKFLAVTVKTIIPAGNGMKMPPVWRATAGTSGHTQPNSRHHRQDDHTGGEME